MILSPKAAKVYLPFSLLADEFTHPRWLALELDENYSRIGTEAFTTGVVSVTFPN